jgi:hypothetical protein
MIRQVLPRIMCLYDEYKCTQWHHVTNHLIISNDKDFNTQKTEKDIHIHDSGKDETSEGQQAGQGCENKGPRGEGGKGEGEGEACEGEVLEMTSNEQTH